ncbi:MAG: leucine-rich repeat protein [Clostridia bacterium]|nr:leucine-rich repeat protein [Clostridia bacterium]
MLKKISLLFSLALLTVICAFSANAGFLAYEEQPYSEMEEIKIIDHVVYKFSENSKGEKYYQVFDWFDTKEASEAVKEINIVPEIDGIKVTQIGKHMNESEGGKYSRNKNYSVKKITIPDTVVRIEDYFFSVLDGVEELTIPASIKSFYPNGIYDDGLRITFVGMENLKKVTVLGDLESLGGFKDCKKLETVVLKGSVNEITSGSFENCTALKNIQIPKSVKKIGDRAFANTSITSVTLPANVMLGHYNGYVFENCKKLTNVVFVGDKNDWIEIYNGSFKNCTALKSVTFPKNIKGMTVYESAFINCKALQSVKFPATCGKLTIGDDAFRNCTSLKTVTLPKTTTGVTIGYRAFRNCQKLSKVYYATNIEKIYGGAFRGCVSLTSLTLNKIKMIGKNAFYGCKKLKTITVNGKSSAPKIYKNAFYNTAKGIKFTAKNEAAAKKWKTALSSSGLKNMKVVYLKYISV